jgi:hypothetical protein
MFSDTPLGDLVDLRRGRHLSVGVPPRWAGLLVIPRLPTLDGVGSGDECCVGPLGGAFQ